MKTEGSVVIDRAIEDVFPLTTNHVAEWSSIVVEDYVVEDHNDGGVGTKFHTITEDRGRRMEFDGVVTRHDPPNLTTIEMTGPAFHMEVAYSFDRLSRDQTRVTQFSVVHGRGIFRIVLLLIGWTMRRSSCDAVQRELENLKRFCEQNESAERSAM